MSSSQLLTLRPPKGIEALEAAPFGVEACDGERDNLMAQIDFQGILAAIALTMLMSHWCPRA